MEPVSFAAERIKSFRTSTERFVKGMLQRFHERSRQNPIEILKRLQREAFSDLMKLRDRQDKVERILSFYQAGKEGPFQEARTHMKGIIDADGFLMFVQNDYQQALHNLDKVGTRSGVDLRFIFETPIRQRDRIVAEFLASHCSLFNHNNMNERTLALSKLVYLTNFFDWLSGVFVPFGAQCTEFGIANFQQGRNKSKCSSFGPPLFHQHQYCGIGFTVKESNIAASLAGLVHELGVEAGSNGNIGLSTFWQVSYKMAEEASLTMSAIWQTGASSQLLKLGPIVFPRSSFKQRTSLDACIQERSSATQRVVVDSIATSSIALKIESQFDESTNFDCWVEMRKSRPSLLKWGVSLSDAPQDELGWGLKMGGQIEGHFNQFWLESFLSFNLGKKAVLQPGLVYVLNEKSQTPALLLRSSWFM